MRITCTWCRLRTYCNVNRAKYPPYLTCLRKSVETLIVILLLRLRKAELRRLRLFDNNAFNQYNAVTLSTITSQQYVKLLALFDLITIVIRWTSVSNIEKLNFFRI